MDLSEASCAGSNEKDSGSINYSMKMTSIQFLFFNTDYWRVMTEKSTIFMNFLCSIKERISAIIFEFIASFSEIIVNSFSFLMKNFYSFKRIYVPFILTHDFLFTHPQKRA